MIENNSDTNLINTKMKSVFTVADKIRINEYLLSAYLKQGVSTIDKKMIEFININQVPPPIMSIILPQELDD